MELPEVIKGLPKAEQHIHLIGSMRPETLLWLIDESGSASPFQGVEDMRGFSPSSNPTRRRFWNTSGN